MSRRGEITVECDSDDCYAEVIYRPENLDEPVHDLLTADGWVRKDGKDYCVECVRPENPRERGDDDGVEYGHPGDRLKGID
jgi:hypothetical protein